MSDNSLAARALNRSEILREELTKVLAERDELREACKIIIPLAEARIEVIDAHTCNHDEFCHCDFVAQAYAAIDKARALALLPVPEKGGEE